MAGSLSSIQNAVIRCTQCRRLEKYRVRISHEKRAAFREEIYWGKPVPGFGDPKAQLLIVGLAPAAHGANRTGRMFTGDRSGEWLYRALHRAGFANQPQSLHIDDGLTLANAYVTAVVRCAPPDNKPTRNEIEKCSSFLIEELKIFDSAKVYLALGKIAWDGLWDLLPHPGARPKFFHGARVDLPTGQTVIGSYHPSQQNTFTRRLTEPMFDQIFSLARSILRS